MPLAAIVVLAAGTYGFRLAGPALRHRLRLPDPVKLTEGHSFAGWARPAGVLAGGVLAARRAPFPVVVVAACATTALLRLLGVP
jgi:hypothetical protein